MCLYQCVFKWEVCFPGNCRVGWRGPLLQPALLGSEAAQKFRDQTMIGKKLPGLGRRRMIVSSFFCQNIFLAVSKDQILCKLFSGCFWSWGECWECPPHELLPKPITVILPASWGPNFLNPTFQLCHLSAVRSLPLPFYRSDRTLDHPLCLTLPCFNLPICAIIPLGLSVSCPNFARFQPSRSVGWNPWCFLCQPCSILCGSPWEVARFRITSWSSKLEASFKL